MSKLASVHSRSVRSRIAPTSISVLLVPLALGCGGGGGIDTLGGSTSPLCAAQAIEGTWVNPDQFTLGTRQVDIVNPCNYSSGPQITVEVFGTCGTGGTQITACSQGSTVALRTFTDNSTGFPQITRVDASYSESFGVTGYIALLDGDELILYTMNAFTDGRPSTSQLEHLVRP